MADTEFHPAAVDEEIASSVPAVEFPVIDRLVGARALFRLAPDTAYMRSFESAAAACDARIIDECYRGVKYSPDGLCLLACLEKSTHTTRRTTRGTQRKKARRITEEKHQESNVEEAKSTIDSDTSTSSSDSSSSSSSSDSESDSDPDAPLPSHDLSDRRGLCLYELPPLRWRQPTDSTDVATVLAGSYEYDIPPPHVVEPVDPNPAVAARHTTPVLRCDPGESIYDFIWNPVMNSSQPSSCFFLSTARSNPIHAWDAFTGRMRASWSGYDQMEELESAISLCASFDGRQIYAGYNKCIRIFDIDRPGRECTRIPTWCKRSTGVKRGKRGGGGGSCLSQSGIISCMALNHAHNHLLACGSYNGEVGLYDLRSSSEFGSGLEHKLFLDSHGISQIEFSKDGLYMFVSVRRGQTIRVFDMRAAHAPMMELPRISRTNQKLAFDVSHGDSRFLACGDSDGYLMLFDLNLPPSVAPADADAGGGVPILDPIVRRRVSNDAVSCVTIHPHFGSTVPLLATCSGERHFFIDEREEEKGEVMPVKDDHAAPIASSSSSSPSMSIDTAAAPIPTLHSLAVWTCEHTILQQAATNGHEQL